VTTSGANLIYTPSASYAGTDAFSYTILDSKGASAQSSASVTVLGSINHLPVAGYVYTWSSSIANIDAGAASDPDGDTLSVVALGQPSFGTAAIISSTQIMYTRATGYTGADRFTYTISDGRGGLATSSVIVNPTTASTALTANSDTVSVQTGHSVTFDPRTNDTSSSGASFIVFSNQKPQHGIVSIAADGTSITYTPPTGFISSEFFSYTIVDQYSNISNGSINVTVTP
jgi:hypothetical protein